MPHSRRRKFNVHKNQHNASMQKENVLMVKTKSKTELQLNLNEKREPVHVKENNKENHMTSKSNCNDNLRKKNSDPNFQKEKVTTESNPNEKKSNPDMLSNKNQKNISNASGNIEEDDAFKTIANKPAQNLNEKKCNADAITVCIEHLIEPNVSTEVEKYNVSKMITNKPKIKHSHKRDNSNSYDNKIKVRPRRKAFKTEQSKGIQNTKDVGLTTSTDIEEELYHVELKFTAPTIEAPDATLDDPLTSISTLYIESNTQTPVSIANQYDNRAATATVSDNSINNMCRICHSGESFSSEMGPLVSACSCRGTVGEVHVKCLERWLTESGKSRCELCGIQYRTRKVHKYGVPRSLMMWLFSQNAKQLMVDSLGIIMMSPLAVLAAWLSGKTLNSLITPENQLNKPWPLASTFVLACMTLVCYYCWVVSAATRHALAWWIWYRSQYEVQLQMLCEENSP